MVLTLLSLAIAQLRGTMTEEQIGEIGKAILKIPTHVQQVLDKINDKVERLSLIFTYARNFLYLGRGYSYPVALEGALKLKEISYIHAEGYRRRDEAWSHRSYRSGDALGHNSAQGPPL